jgi:hypothetical protein
MAAMKLIVMCSLALSSNSQKFLPLNRDPADALADNLLNKAGFDSDSFEPERKVPQAVVKYVDKLQSHDSSANADPTLVDHSKDRLSAKDLMGLKPVIATGTLSSPREWAAVSSDKSDDSSLSSLRDGMKHMYQDLARTPSSASVSDWGDFHADSSETSKEIVKVDVRDAIVRQPVQQTVPQVSASDGKRSAPTYVSKLRITDVPVPASGTSAGLRWFHKESSQAHAAEDALRIKIPQHDKATGFVNATQLKESDAVESMRGEAEGRDSLAKSLALHFKIEKKKETLRRQRRDLPTGEEIHTPVAKKVEPQSSALDSRHRGLRGSNKMLPIRPEDVRNSTEVDNEEAESEEMPEKNLTKPVLRLPVKKSRGDPDEKEKPKQEPSTHITQESPAKNLFTMHATGGFVDANGMDAALDELGTKKNWNWRLFDKDGDGKLSEQEFANAVNVAQRFKAQKS